MKLSTAWTTSAARRWHARRPAGRPATPGRHRRARGTAPSRARRLPQSPDEPGTGRAADRRQWPRRAAKAGAAAPAAVSAHIGRPVRAIVSLMVYILEPRFRPCKRRHGLGQTQTHALERLGEHGFRGPPTAAGPVRLTRLADPVGSCCQLQQRAEKTPSQRRSTTRHRQPQRSAPILPPGTEQAAACPGAAVYRRHRQYLHSNRFAHFPPKPIDQAEFSSHCGRGPIRIAVARKALRVLDADRLGQVENPALPDITSRLSVRSTSVVAKAGDQLDLERRRPVIQDWLD